MEVEGSSVKGGLICRATHMMNRLRMCAWTEDVWQTEDVCLDRPHSHVPRHTVSAYPFAFTQEPARARRAEEAV